MYCIVLVQYIRQQKVHHFVGLCGLQQFSKKLFPRSYLEFFRIILIAFKLRDVNHYCKKKKKAKHQMNRFLKSELNILRIRDIVI